MPRTVPSSSIPHSSLAGPAGFAPFPSSSSSSSSSALRPRLSTNPDTANMRRAGVNIPRALDFITPRTITPHSLASSPASATFPRSAGSTTPTPTSATFSSFLTTPTTPRNVASGSGSRARVVRVVSPHSLSPSSSNVTHGPFRSALKERGILKNRMNASRTSNEGYVSATSKASSSMLAVPVSGNKALLASRRPSSSSATENSHLVPDRRRGRNGDDLHGSKASLPSTSFLVAQSGTATSRSRRAQQFPSTIKVIDEDALRVSLSPPAPGPNMDADASHLRPPPAHARTSLPSTTALGEPPSVLYGPQGAQAYASAFSAAIEEGYGDGSIEMAIALARVGYERRKHSGEKDVWLDSLLAVKENHDGCEIAKERIEAVQSVFPGLLALTESVTLALAALDEQTKEFYSFANTKWWAFVPAPPSIVSEALEVAFALNNREISDPALAAGMLLHLRDDIEAQRLVYCDLNHPQHAPIFQRVDSVKSAKDSMRSLTPDAMLETTRRVMELTISA